MKRKRNLFVNIFLIVSLISISMVSDFYFYGSFLSKEECAVDSAKALYLPEGEIEHCLEDGNEYRYLYVNEDEKLWSIIGVKKDILFYRPSSSYTHVRYDEEAQLDVLFSHSSKNGSWIFVKRKDDRVKFVEIIDESGVYLIDEWKKDYAGIFVESEKAIGKEAIAYDENSIVIDTVEMW